MELRSNRVLNRSLAADTSSSVPPPSVPHSSPSSHVLFLENEMQPSTSADLGGSADVIHIQTLTPNSKRRVLNIIEEVSTPAKKAELDQLKKEMAEEQKAMKKEMAEEQKAMKERIKSLESQLESADLTGMKKLLHSILHFINEGIGGKPVSGKRPVKFARRMQVPKHLPVESESMSSMAFSCVACDQGVNCLFHRNV